MTGRNASALLAILLLTACATNSGLMPAVDSGSSDGGPSGESDAGVSADVDGSSALPDSGAPDGSDAGDPGVTPPPPVDCSAITSAGFELCGESDSGCEAIYDDSEGCTAVCAAAGLVCVGAHEDVAGTCAADMSRPALGCESGHQSDYCVCARDTTCTASCDARTCGSDGCGGSCGSCGAGTRCVAGACEAGAVDCSSYPYDPGALLGELVGFGHRAVGGDPSRVYHVTNTRSSGGGSLRAALESTEAYWIVFDVGETGQARIDMGSERVRVRSNKTVDGRGRDIVIDGALELRDGARNIILSDLRLTNSHGDRCTQDADVILVRGDGADTPGGFENRDLWFHHLDLYEGGDGLLDVRGGSRITVSWCHMHNHSKGMLLSMGSAPDIEGREMEITFHHNFFNQLSRRGPRQSNGRVHYFNNYNLEWWEYGVAVVNGAEFRSENNIYQARPGSTCGSIFSPCTDPAPCGDTDYEVSKIAVSTDWASDVQGYVSSSGDLLLEDAAVSVREPARVFTPAYPYSLEPATPALGTRLRAETGPRTAYCR